MVAQPATMSLKPCVLSTPATLRRQWLMTRQKRRIDELEKSCDSQRSRIAELESLEEALSAYVQRAAEKLRALHEAQAVAQMQTQLTNARVQAQIAESQGEADLARARKMAEQRVVEAEAELARSRRQAEQTVVLAKAEAEERMLAGRGESQRIMQTGLSEAAVLMRKIGSFGDPRLFALSRVAESLSKSTQPLVPERVFVAGGAGGGDNQQTVQGLLGLLIDLLVAEKSGFQTVENTETARLKQFAEKMESQALDSMNRNGQEVTASA